MKDAAKQPPGSVFIGAEGASAFYELDGEVYCVSRLDPKPPGSGALRYVLIGLAVFAILAPIAWVLGRLAGL